MHGSATKAARAKAQERILQAADPAAAKLISLMQDPDVPYAVQASVAKDLLDRAGLTSKQVLEVEVNAAWEDLVAGAVAEVPDDTAMTGATSTYDRDDVVDAEIVEDRGSDVEYSPGGRRLGGRAEVHLPDAPATASPRPKTRRR